MKNAPVLKPLVVLTISLFAAVWAQAQTIGGVNKTWSIRGLQNTYALPRTETCGVGVQNTYNGQVGCLVPMEVTGFNPFYGGTCAQTNPYAPMGARYLDSPGMRHPSWGPDGCGTQPAQNDACVHGITFENIDVYTYGDGCPPGASPDSGAIIQPVDTFSLALNNVDDWAPSWHPFGVPNGQLDAQWQHGPGNGGPIQMWSTYYGVTVFGTEGQGYASTNIYEGPEILTLVSGGPNGGSCTFQPPSGLSANFATSGWAQQGSGSQWTLPGYWANTASPCGSMIHANTVGFATLVNVTMDNQIDAMDQGNVIIYVNGDYKIIGMLEARNLANTTQVYMDDISSTIGALDNEGRTASGLGSIFNWKIYDPGQVLHNSAIAANATAARMPAEEESRHAEEYKIPADVYRDINNLNYKDGNDYLLVTTMRYDVQSQTWYVGITGGCGGRMPSAAMANKIRDLMRPYTNAPVEFEPSGGLIVGGAAPKHFTIQGCSK